MNSLRRKYILTKLGRYMRKNPRWSLKNNPYNTKRYPNRFPRFRPRPRVIRRVKVGAWAPLRDMYW